MRAMFQLQIKPDHLPAYVEAHAAVARDMLEALRDAGWRNYSLFLAPEGRVIGYFEADDVDEVQRLVALTEADTRWQARMAEHFVLGLDGEAAPVEFLTPIFNLNDQLEAEGLTP